MRAVSLEERNKRGCLYCTDFKKAKSIDGRKVRACKYDECPYHELDGYETYEDFFNSQGGLLEDLFGEGME